ncbi:M23 family metallopeptidase [Thermosulfurimonas marina]|uniref:M23 family metallopeptidase n=1 Tax=Thermosulfurimonas marina TaxID=2047767 RepID=A0A6H1WRA5_9BACT|nr:M23 family metallopeptidase [Thermosulfurimonas marina]QJA05698.1 M23 family metallopeptidase [Thermosulfurimonas marina]
MGKFFKTLLWLLLLGGLLAGGGLFFYRYESSPPEVKISGISELLGREFKVRVEVRDPRSGLRSVRIALRQKDRAAVLREETFPVSFLKGSPVKEKVYEFAVRPLEVGLSEGPVELVVQARDGSWQQAFRGNLRQKVLKARLDLTPPAVALLSARVYLARGGSALVLYRVGEPVARTGVYLNEHFFRGYPVKDHLYAALVGLPVTEKGISRFVVLAQDEAGNRLEIPVNYFYQRRKYPVYRLRISEAFLSRKMPEFLSRYPEAQKGSLLETFVWVNETLRQRNNQKIAEITSQVSQEPFRIKGALRALPRAAKRSDFGEYRLYYYKGRKVSESWHLGLDLASVAGAEVPAAAAGKVVFAGYLGIYGNTVILDHGLGLYTVYAHLAGIEVSVGQEVEAGQTIGHTDTTGLAGGDHLHFSVLVQGVFVQPLEWLDPHWVRVRILGPLSALP